MSDLDPEPPQRPRVVVALALGVVAALLLAAAAIVITRDLAGGGDPESPKDPAPASTFTPEPSPWPNTPPPVNGCGSTSETPRGIEGQAAGRKLCHRFADRLRKNTDAMFECTIDDRIEDCRDEAGTAWVTLTALQADPSYPEAKALLDGAFELAEENGSRYRSPDCVGTNGAKDDTAAECTASYSTFGVGLSSLEYLLRSL